MNWLTYLLVVGWFAISALVILSCHDSERDNYHAAAVVIVAVFWPIVLCIMIVVHLFCLIRDLIRYVFK